MMIAREITDMVSIVRVGLDDFDPSGPVVGKFLKNRTEDKTI